MAWKIEKCHIKEFEDCPCVAEDGDNEDEKDTGVRCDDEEYDMQLITRLRFQHN